MTAETSLFQLEEAESEREIYKSAMASAREYSNLTGGVRRDVVSMIERAVAVKRKGEGLVVHGSQCHGFIDSQLATVRETSFLDGEPQRCMTLVAAGGDQSGKMELTLEVSLAGSAGQAASRAAKKWGGGKTAAGASEETARPRRSKLGRRGGGGGGGGGVVETLVLDTERVLRARRDAGVVVNVRERDAERGRRGSQPGGSGRGKSSVQEALSWSSVRLTAEEIFRECSGKWWVGEKEDGDHVYCVVKQSCNVDRDFAEYLSAIQIHIYGVMKLQGLQ